MRRAGVHRTASRRSASRRGAAGRLVAVALTLGALAAVLAAPGPAAASTPTTATTISTAKSTKFGTILVSGTTVYVLKPSKTSCTGKCLKVWPPVLLPQGVTSATAGPGVDASKLGTVAASNGNLQITYGGKPLYWFAKDKTPGQVKGNVSDKWGKWHTVVLVKGSGSGNSNAGTGATAF